MVFVASLQHSTKRASCALMYRVNVLEQFAQITLPHRYIQYIQYKYTDQLAYDQKSRDGSCCISLLCKLSRRGIHSSLVHILLG